MFGCRCFCFDIRFCYYYVIITDCLFIYRVFFLSLNCFALVFCSILFYSVHSSYHMFNYVRSREKKSRQDSTDSRWNDDFTEREKKKCTSISCNKEKPRKLNIYIEIQTRGIGIFDTLISILVYWPYVRIQECIHFLSNEFVLCLKCEKEGKKADNIWNVREVCFKLNPKLSEANECKIFMRIYVVCLSDACLWCLTEAGTFRICTLTYV